MENTQSNNENLEKDLSAKNDTNKIIMAIVLVGFLIAGSILLKDSKRPESNTENTVQKVEIENIREVSQDEHILGNKEAEIFIVEYSDTECPFCKVFHNTMHKIITENPKVAWVYRHYPIPQLHQKAFNEALATECAWEWGGNDLFWSYTDEIYKRTESNDKLPVEELTQIAVDLQMNVSTFTECLESEKYAKKVENDVLDGEKAGVQGTPTSFIVRGGKVIDTIEGAQPIEIVREKVKEALRK